MRCRAMLHLSLTAAALTAVGACTSIPTVAAEPPNPHVWNPGVRSVAVFKNGTGFFMRDGEVQLRDGWCVSGAVPPALFGTLAIYAADEAHLVDLVGAGPGDGVDFDAAREPNQPARDGNRPAGDANQPAASSALLSRYLGLNVELTLGRETPERKAVGRLTEVTGTYAILKRDENLSAVPQAAITRLQVLDYPLRLHVSGPEENGTARLGMAYLRKGITWIPEYSLRIIDESTAELTLRATLVNEVEDLVDTDVHFVVGVPRFLHADLLSPLAVGQTIRTVAAALPSALPPGVQTQVMSNAIMSRAATAADQRATATAEPVAVPEAGGDVEGFMRGLPQMPSAGASDFTVYTRPHMTVRKGEKAVVTVFRKRITYAHAYRWDSPGDLKHYLMLHNDTDTAWTTGPVVAVSGTQPLCEDLLCYTPRNSPCEIPVTTAVNVATEASESEVDRKLKAHQPAANLFLDLVVIEGHLRVRNYEPRPVKLTVRRAVPGLLTTVSEGGTMEQDTSKLRLVERAGAATWTLDLPAGETRELTYRYERYVDSR